MGITRVCDLTRFDRIGIPVFQAVHPNGRTVSASFGKGLYPDWARASAIMEAVETWHAEVCEVPSFRSSVASMRPVLPYDVFDLPVARPTLLNDWTALDWVEARSVVDASPVPLPKLCASIDFTDPRNAVPLFSRTSNGLASGNTLEEAVRHGLFELLERHAIACAANRPWQELAVPATAPGGALSDRAVTAFEAAGVSLYVQDLTPLVGIPTFRTIIWSEDVPRLFQGAGCHTDPDIAYLRSLTEAAQARITQMVGARDNIVDRERVTRQPTELVALAQENRSSQDALPEAPDIIDVVAGLTSGPPLYVDLTRGDILIPVVMVVAPGLKDPYG